MLRQEDDLIVKVIDNSKKAIDAHKEVDKEKRVSFDKTYVLLI